MIKEGNKKITDKWESLDRRLAGSLIHTVPATAVKLWKSRVLSLMPGVKSVSFLILKPQRYGQKDVTKFYAFSKTVSLGAAPLLTTDAFCFSLCCGTVRPDGKTLSTFAFCFSHSDFCFLSLHQSSQCLVL